MRISNKFKNDWRAVCDRCGRWTYASKLKQEWTGLMTCSSCWEPRNTQDFLKGKQEHIAPPWTRPHSGEPTTFCTLSGKSSLSDYATADCAVTGNDSLFYLT